MDGPREFISPSSNWSHKNNILTLPYVPKIGSLMYKITYKGIPKDGLVISKKIWLPNIFW